MEGIIEEEMEKEEVNLGEKDIDDAALEYLCQMDTSSKTLLNLHQNSITAVGTLNFSLAKWDNLTSLILSLNNIGSRGCQYLTRASMNGLQQLCLGNNGIESQGVSHLAKGQWRQLNTIWLDYNKISNGISPIVKSSNWKNLTTISLYSNGLTNTHILEIIVLEAAITQVDLEENYFEQSDGEALGKAIEDKFGQLAMNI